MFPSSPVKYNISDLGPPLANRPHRKYLTANMRYGGELTSVIELQNTQTATTLSKVKRVSKNAPSILPCEGLQMWTEMT